MTSGENNQIFNKHLLCGFSLKKGFCSSLVFKEVCTTPFNDDEGWFFLNQWFAPKLVVSKLCL